MNPYATFTKVECVQRLDQYIAKIDGKVSEGRSNRTLVTKVFLERIKQLLMEGGKPIGSVPTKAPVVINLDIEREGYNDQKIWNKGLGENPYEVHSDANSEHRRWNRGWWLAKNGKSEPKEENVG
jgi:hypothetical protein